VARLVLEELGWIFREQHESDRGIDAIVETVVDGRPTGRLIALQIKSGSSYFAEVCPGGGWVMRGPKRHRAYWLKHQLPVLVVLFDTNTGYGYWVHANPDTAKSTSKGYRIDIPAAQVLDASAKNQIEKIIDIWIKSRDGGRSSTHNDPLGQTATTAAELAELEELSTKAARQHHILVQLRGRYSQIARQSLKVGDDDQAHGEPIGMTGARADVTAQRERVQKPNASGRDGSSASAKATGLSTVTTERGRSLPTIWHHYNALRNDISTIDLVEQFTYLMLLKIAHEKVSDGGSRNSALVSLSSAWQFLLSLDGQNMIEEYDRILQKLGRRGDSIAVVFRAARNKILDPTELKKLISDLNTERLLGPGMEVESAVYEKLLAQVAEDLTSGAGQYFTPRQVIRAMVDCIQPAPDDTIGDPACGTGGFLIVARDYIERHHRSLAGRQCNGQIGNGISGVELAQGPAQLATMNLLLHGIGAPGDSSAIEIRDALAEPPRSHASLVLSNPPWGRAPQTRAGYARNDFWVTTHDMALNFIQHIVSMLAVPGRAAVVLPDGALFARGGAETIRRHLLSQCDVHTLLRLPTGVFYARGVKANVLFFDKRSASPDTPQTSTLWVYDFRTGQRFTSTGDRLTQEHLKDFVRCYRPGEPRDSRIETMRFKPFGYDELMTRDGVNLDITWRDDSCQDDAYLELTVTARALLEEFDDMLTDLTVLVESIEQANDPPSSP